MTCPTARLDGILQIRTPSTATRACSGAAVALRLPVMDILDCDYLVLGSGVAGLMSAINLAPHGRVLVVTKKDRAESNTNSGRAGILAEGEDGRGQSEGVHHFGRHEKQPESKSEH